MLSTVEQQRRLSANLRLEAAEYGRRRWAALADHSLTPAECDSLERVRWSLIVKAGEIERSLRGIDG